GFFMARNRIWETVALLLVTFLLLRPGFFLDLVQPPFDVVEPRSIHEAVEREPDDAEIRLQIVGPSFDNPDQMRERTMAFNLGPAGEPGDVRPEKATGLIAQIDGDAVVLEEPMDMNSRAARAL